MYEKRDTKVHTLIILSVMLSRRSVAEKLYESMTAKSCHAHQHELMKPIVSNIVDEMDKQLGFGTKEYRLCYR